MWPLVGGILGGLAALVSAIVGYRALVAKRAVDEGLKEVAEIKISIESLQAALARADIERDRLSTELGEAWAEIRRLRAEVWSLNVALAKTR